MEYWELLEKVLSERGADGLKVCSVKESACTKPGDNYMSVVSTLEVEGTLPRGGEYRTNVFAKRPPGSSQMTQDFHIDEAFSNEVLMYLQVLPLYGASVGTAHCYHAATDLILLEDLKAAGYRAGDRPVGFDLHSSTQVLKALAKFHAASFQARLTKGEEFTKVTNHLKPIGLVLSHNKDMLEACLRRAILLVSGVQELEEVVPCLQNLQGRVFEYLKKLREARSVAVLCHGDFWINNILVRPDSEDPVRIIDLQACATHSPAVDLWTFLYTSVQPSLMEDHLQQLLQVYCSSFVHELAATLQVPPAYILPASELMEEINSKELYGFLVALIYLPALDLSGESAPDLENVTKEQLMDDTFMVQFSNAGLKDRICNLIRFCRKRGMFGKHMLDKFEL